MINELNENDIEKMSEIKSYLETIKTELIMTGYHDGWTVKWLENKVVELNNKLDKFKHKFT
tara:strand:+ start:28 stop:210 length:183 start_codon:yes stop_codon:yes gene_type:complete